MMLYRPALRLARAYDTNARALGVFALVGETVAIRRPLRIGINLTLTKGDCVAGIKIVDDKLIFRLGSPGDICNSATLPEKRTRQIYNETK